MTQHSTAETSAGSTPHQAVQAGITCIKRLKAAAAAAAAPPAAVLSHLLGRGTPLPCNYYALLKWMIEWCDTHSSGLCVFFVSCPEVHGLSAHSPGLISDSNQTHMSARGVCCCGSSHDRMLHAPSSLPMAAASLIPPPAAAAAAAALDAAAASAAAAAVTER